MSQDPKDDGKSKICPLMSGPVYNSISDIYEQVTFECQKERCMWWASIDSKRTLACDPHVYGCAISKVSETTQKS